MPLGVASRKRLAEVGGGACLHLMDGTEEMSGTFFPHGGGETAATSPPHSHSCLPAQEGGGVGGICLFYRSGNRHKEIKVTGLTVVIIATIPLKRLIICSILSFFLTFFSSIA